MHVTKTSTSERCHSDMKYLANPAWPARAKVPSANSASSAALQAIGTRRASVYMSVRPSGGICKT